MTSLRRLPATSARSLDGALVVVGALALLLGLFEMRLFPLDGPAGWLLVVLPVVFWIYIAAGLIAWWLRPANGMGLLILVAGVLVFVSGAGNTDAPALVAVAAVGATLPIPAIAHLLLAFPAGRLPDRVSRGLVVALYVASIVLGAPAYLLAADGTFPPFAIADLPDVVGAVSLVNTIVGSTLMLVVAIVLVRRLRRAEPRHRRVLAWLYSYGIFAVLALPLLAIVFDRVLGWDPIARGFLQFGVSAGIPIAFALGVLRGGFARTAELEELGTWLSETGSGPTLVQDALARTLGDPSLRLALWDEESGGFVDVEGSPVSAQPSDPRRGWEGIELDGRTIGAIDYDAALLGDPQLVRNAGRVAGIAVERERLTAELRASRRAVLESRERLVEAADRERRRIARDLHDGLQAQLVLFALEAQQIASAPASAVRAQATALRRSIDATAAELRAFVHDLMPAALIERGLPAAASDLADRMPVPTLLDVRLPGRLAEAVESTAYYVLAESLTNVVKHAHASQVTVRMAYEGSRFVLEVIDDGRGGAAPGRTLGLGGMHDRVVALGGALRVRSEKGAGTTVRMEAPCVLS